MWTLLKNLFGPRAPTNWATRYPAAFYCRDKHRRGKRRIFIRNVDVPYGIVDSRLRPFPGNKIVTNWFRSKPGKENRPTGFKPFKTLSSTSSIFNPLRARQIKVRRPCTHRIGRFCMRLCRLGFAEHAWIRGREKGIILRKVNLSIDRFFVAAAVSMRQLELFTNFESYSRRNLIALTRQRILIHICLPAAHRLLSGWLIARFTVIYPAC